MHTAEIRGKVEGRSADEVFAALTDFERYPEYGKSIRSIDVQEKDGAIVSSWDVDFRGGSMQWTEEDHVDEANRRIDFQQVSGNLRAFSGFWQIGESNGDAEVHFHCEFEMGMPTLASFMDPIAEATIRENMTAVLEGLFGESYKQS